MSGDINLCCAPRPNIRYGGLCFLMVAFMGLFFHYTTSIPSPDRRTQSRNHRNSFRRTSFRCPLRPKIGGYEGCVNILLKSGTVKSTSRSFKSPAQSLSTFPGKTFGLKGGSARCGSHCHMILFFKAGGNKRSLYSKLSYATCLSQQKV